MLSIAITNFLLSPFSIVCILPVALVGWVVYQRCLSPLAGIPGPFWASVTRLWYLNRINRGDMHRYTAMLHKKHGPIVRIAPDEVSIGDPHAMKAIYAVNSGYTKTDFYAPHAPKFSPRGDSFSEMSEKRHSHRRRMISNLYSMTSVLESERYLDTVTSAMLQRMEEYAARGDILDLSEWLHMYAFDVIGELFFGRPIGCIREGRDVGGYMAAGDVIFKHGIRMGVLPRWVRPVQFLLFPFSKKLQNALGCFTALTQVAKSYVMDRQNGKSQRTDLLDKLLAVSKRKGDEFDIRDVFTESYTALFAGSDTTAMVLRSAIYHVCKHPQVYAKVQAEIDQAHAAGKLGHIIQYAEAIKLPYLDATLKEAMRVHPCVGLTLPRHVPEGGRILCSHFLPEGTRLGINAYVVHQNTAIFGDDADKFNPDRWFRPEAAHMDRHMFQFGAGSRTCIGKHIGLSEVYKFTPQFLRAFKVELANPEAEWRECNIGFVKQTDIFVKLTRRYN